MTIREAMKIIQDQGVCSLACMPYVVQNINVLPTAEQRKAAAPYRAKSYARLNTIVEMEAYLMASCFIAGVLVHEPFMERILPVTGAGVIVPQQRRVRLVVAEQCREGRPVRVQIVSPELGMIGLHRHMLSHAQARLWCARLPAPGVAEPQLR